MVQPWREIQLWRKIVAGLFLVSCIVWIVLLCALCVPAQVKYARRQAICQKTWCFYSSYYNADYHCYEDDYDAQRRSCCSLPAQYLLPFDRDDPGDKCNDEVNRVNLIIVFVTLFAVCLVAGVLVLFLFPYGCCTSDKDRQADSVVIGMGVAVYPGDPRGQVHK